MERKQAYVIIRHVKFGPSKKSGGKKFKAVGDGNGVSKTATRTAFSEDDPAEFGTESEDETLSDAVGLPSSSPTVMRDNDIEKNNTAWSASNSRDDFNELFDLADDTKRVKVMNTAAETVHHAANLDASNFSRPKPAETLRSTPPESFSGTENRYIRSEPRNQFPQKSIDNRGPGVRDSFRSEPEFPNQRRQPPPNMNTSPSMGQNKQVGTDASGFRNPNFSKCMPKQEPSHPDVPSTQASGYGIFSNTKANAPPKQGNPSGSVRNPGTAGAGANQNIPGLKSDGSQRPGNDNGGQGKWGIFSK